MTIAAPALPGNITLHLMDCLEGMLDDTVILPGSQSVIVTSPPYNQDVAYGTYRDRMPRAKYLDWLMTVFGACSWVAEPDASLFLNLGGSDPTLPFAVAEKVSTSWTLQNTIIWVKSLAVPVVGADVTLGHFKPVNSPRYLNRCFEYVFHFTKHGDVSLDKLAIGVPYADKTNLTRGNRGKNGDRRDRGNVWFIPYPTIQSRDRDRPHPASFPVELAVACLKLHGLENIKSVLDPFMGIGATARAAVRLGLPCVGFEIDPAYHETACLRVRDEDARLEDLVR